MDLPILPNDSLYKFAFFAGIAFIYFSLTLMQPKYEQLTDKYYSYKKSFIEFKVQEQKISQKVSEISIDEKESIKLRKDENDQLRDKLTEMGNDKRKIAVLVDQIRSGNIRIAKHDWLSSKNQFDKSNDEFSDWVIKQEGKISEIDENIGKKRVELNQLQIEFNKQKDLMEMDSQRLDEFTRKTNHEHTVANIFYLFGGILLIAGLFKWLGFQSKQDRIFISQYNDVFKICQSCGMELSVDKNITPNAKYCSHCFDGTDFTEPNLTKDQMKRKMEEKMKSQKIDFLSKQTYLQRLSRLDRWRKVFRW